MSKAELIELLRGYARRYGIDESIAIAQIQQESSFNPRASSGEAFGIAQFTPATARRFGVNVWDVNSSFDGWGRYMRWLLDRFNGNYEFALAGYNAGEGNVDRYGGVPPFPETRNYVSKILGNANGAAHTAGFPIDSLPTSQYPLPTIETSSGGVSALQIGVFAVVGLLFIDWLTAS